VTNITEHNTEHEGESSDGEKSRIDFSISGNTVCVDDFLVGTRNIIKSEMSWGRFIFWVVSDREFTTSNSRITLSEFAQGLLDLFNRFLRNPNITVINSILKLEGVEIMIDGLLLGNEILDVFYVWIFTIFSTAGLREEIKNILNMGLGDGKDGLGVTDLFLVFSNLELEGLVIFWDTISGKIRILENLYLEAWKESQTLLSLDLIISKLPPW
jgi:hypothetical protein